MGTVLDVGVIAVVVGVWLTLGAGAGAIAHKLSTLYDYQSKLTVKDLALCSLGVGWFLLLVVLLMCMVLRSQGLYWHDRNHPRTPAQKKAEFLKGAKVTEADWREVSQGGGQDGPKED